MATANSLVGSGIESRLMLTDKEFKEFGTMTEEMERGGQPSYSSEENGASAARGRQINVPNGRGRTEQNKTTRRGSYEILSHSVAETESFLSATTDKFPDVGQSTSDYSSSTVHQEGSIVLPSATSADATATPTAASDTRISNKTEEEATASQEQKESKCHHQRSTEVKAIGRRIGNGAGVDKAKKEEEKHVCKCHNIKYCQGQEEIGYWDMSSQPLNNTSREDKERRRKLARNDDMNKNARQCDRRHQKHDRPEQYCNTCSRSCQFCPPIASEATRNVIVGASTATSSPPAPPVRMATDQEDTKNNTGR